MDYQTIVSLIQFNSGKTQVSSISPPDVFDTMKSVLDISYLNIGSININKLFPNTQFQSKSDIRMSVPLELRSSGLIISYRFNGVDVSEKFIGNPQSWSGLDQYWDDIDDKLEWGEF